MAKLDLRVQNVRLWRECLPDDVKLQVPEFAESISDEDAVALVHALSGVSAKRIPSVLHDRAKLLAGAPRAVRVRILAWSVNRADTDAALMLREITDAGDDDTESGEGDRTLVAGKFREDIDAIGVVTLSRIVRAATDKATLAVIDSGLKEFEMSADLKRPGGM